MRFISLFSGIGGLDLGLERAGMTCVAQVENDEWCTRVLEKHWPDVPRWKDVHDVEELPDADLIAGGFPCQPVSYAGKRKGQDDPRWLWPQFARIIRLVRPRYVLVENVPGLLTAGFDEVASDLAASGYDFKWSRLSAQAVGAPHLRYRIFLVAYHDRRGLSIEQKQDKRSQQSKQQTSRRNNVDRRCKNVGNANESPPDSHTEKRGPRSPTSEPGWWAVEPDVGRVAHGVPRRVDRLRGLGNAVVPQVAEWVGRQIMEHAA